MNTGALTTVSPTARKQVVIAGGLFTTGHSYSALREHLAEQGVDAWVVPIHKFGFDTVRNDANLLAETVAQASAASRAAGGDGRVSILGHSKGGIVARWYLERMGGMPNVDQLVTYGTPHQGTMPIGKFLSPIAARLPIHPVQELITNGPLMNDVIAGLPAALRQATPGFRIVSVAGDIDRGPINGWDGFIKDREAQIGIAGTDDAVSGAAGLVPMENIRIPHATHVALNSGRFPAFDNVYDTVTDKLLRRT
jgi:hypothetical protein